VAVSASKDKQEPKTAAEMLQMRRKRNFALLGVIASLAVLFYVITIVRMGAD
jgi:hypothetical protein